MVKALFDTNILIDYLNGFTQAKTEIERFQDKAISLITWMEVMVGATSDNEEIIRDFLNEFVMLPVDLEVGALAVKLRRKLRMKLPDAIILASAQSDHRILVTRNIKDFTSDDPGIRIPYSL